MDELTFSGRSNGFLSNTCRLGMHRENYKISNEKIENRKRETINWENVKNGSKNENNQYKRKT